MFTTSLFKKGFSMAPLKVSASLISNWKSTVIDVDSEQWSERVVGLNEPNGKTKNKGNPGGVTTEFWRVLRNTQFENHLIMVLFYYNFLRTKLITIGVMTLHKRK